MNRQVSRGSAGEYHEKCHFVRHLRSFLFCLWLWGIFQLLLVFYGVFFLLSSCVLFVLILDYQNKSYRYLFPSPLASSIVQQFILGPLSSALLEY